LNQFVAIVYDVKKADMHSASIALSRTDLLGISYRITFRDPRLPNRQAANEKIEAHLF